MAGLDLYFTLHSMEDFKQTLDELWSRANIIVLEHSINLEIVASFVVPSREVDIAHLNIDPYAATCEMGLTFSMT